jgi:hypothetical protein
MMNDNVHALPSIKLSICLKGTDGCGLCGRFPTTLTFHCTRSKNGKHFFNVESGLSAKHGMFPIDEMESDIKQLIEEYMDNKYNVGLVDESNTRNVRTA